MLVSVSASGGGDERVKIEEVIYPKQSSLISNRFYKHFQVSVSVHPSIHIYS